MQCSIIARFEGFRTLSAFMNSVKAFMLNKFLVKCHCHHLFFTVEDLIHRGFIKFLSRRSVGFFSQAFLVFLMKERKKRREDENNWAN